MRYASVTLMAGGLLVAGYSYAVEMPDLAKKNGCVACHAIDRKVVGPAWMDVAKKYKGDSGAEAKLIAKVSRGGSGVWGSASMPPIDPSGKKQDAIKELVHFILALGK